MFKPHPEERRIAQTAADTAIYDLLVIGGGVNGAAIANDAAGRGLSVLLCEQHDLASHTSSASSKLVHGGLRYLEHYEFRLVREALGMSGEDEILGFLYLGTPVPTKFKVPRPDSSAFVSHF
mgnify:CR=1 FL=1